MHELVTAEGLAEVVKDQLRRKALELIETHTGDPVLYVFTADSTPELVTLDSFAKGPSGNQNIRRRGRALIEMLLQRGWLKAFSSDGELVMTMLVRDPIPLTTGKKHGNVFTAACQFFPMLRQKGHRGISITHVSFDRALHSGMTRRFRQRLQASYDPAVGPDFGDERRLLSRMDWAVNAP